MRTLKEIEQDIDRITRMPHGGKQCAGCDLLWKVAQELLGDPRRGAERLRRRICAADDWVWISRETLELGWSQGYIGIGRHW